MKVLRRDEELTWLDWGAGPGAPGGDIGALADLPLIGGDRGGVDAALPVRVER